jgi:hypothetical protein
VNINVVTGWLAAGHSVWEIKSKLLGPQASYPEVQCCFSTHLSESLNSAMIAIFFFPAYFILPFDAK